jgi:ankyrin repeat protein
MAVKHTKQTKARIAQLKSTISGQSKSAPVAPLDVTTRDPEGRTPLHLAAFFGYHVMVRNMLQQQAEVDARDNAQRTPAHWSAFKGHLEVMKALVEFGADVNARDGEGRTLLRMAIIGHQPVIEEMLRVRGAVL